MPSLAPGLNFFLLAQIIALYAVRLLAIFMVLPVLAVSARDLGGANALTLGVAFGAYGLTQGLLQIPFGLLSDRWGRKRVLHLGMLCLLAGSVICALADSIYLFILGRFLQGSGAVAGVLLACVGDWFAPQWRLPVMGMVGMTIGAVFIVAMVLGPVFAAVWGLDSIFHFNAFLAVAGMALVYFLPAGGRSAPPAAVFPRLPFEKWFLCFGAFLLHAVMTACWMTFPLRLQRDFALPLGEHWKVYALSLLLSLAAALPLMWLARGTRFLPFLLVLGGGFLALSMFLLTPEVAPFWGLVFFVFFFFGFNLLEACLPTRFGDGLAPESRGAAMGLFTTSQFFGIFAGGALGGALLLRWSEGVLFALCGALALAWTLACLRVLAAAAGK